LLSYVVYRLLWLVPTLLAMALVTFGDARDAGSPLDPVAEGERARPRRRRTSRQASGSQAALRQFAIFLQKAAWRFRHVVRLQDRTR
jgi:hypothetical protein